MDLSIPELYFSRNGYSSNRIELRVYSVEVLVWSERQGILLALQYLSIVLLFKESIGLKISIPSVPII